FAPRQLLVRESEVPAGGSPRAGRQSGIALDQGPLVLRGGAGKVAGSEVVVGEREPRGGILGAPRRDRLQALQLLLCLTIPAVHREQLPALLGLSQTPGQTARGQVGRARARGEVDGMPEGNECFGVPAGRLVSAAQGDEPGWVVG